MKDDEIRFFLTMVRCGRQITNHGTWVGISTRELICILQEYIHHKRCWYLLEKWSRLGFYEYGVSLDLGWLDLDKLPERYKVLI